ncbi:N-acetylglucosaminyldiphosphoundecaprenol N-acetyl-beta-D-mannosaminyltransferase [Burkholderiales bacterium]|nr:MAG: WecB/TagA/CpsF family glycosyltransferase [Burkholderiales bacterium]CAG1010654.1 N-acetylglucosaminyldiphosphoundecaprenol N-acetyl-beta-D-mannosaminyltransferase [Burkholderiales bacterium]
MNYAGEGASPSGKLLGVRIHSVGLVGVLAQIERCVQGNKGGLIANVNIHAMNLAWNDIRYRQILNTADLVFVDGAGVVLGAKIAGVTVGDRITPADWIDALLEICTRRDWPIYWLGDTEEVGEAFELRVRARHPQCPFAGRSQGFFDHYGEAGEALARRIRDSGARVLLVGMSMPLQEKWIARHLPTLGPMACLAVGGLARIYTGHIRRGPRWMTDHGLEWLYRLTMQPGYTWRRYLLGNPAFILRVLLCRLGLMRPPHG